MADHYIYSPETIIKAYSLGLFPMADSHDSLDIRFYDPDRRALIPIDHSLGRGVHIPRRLQRRVRQAPYEVTLDQDFTAVIDACAEPSDQRTDTWINKDIFFSKFPEINDRLKQNIINNKLFYKFQDSLELYLIKIIDYKNKNDIAPFDFIKPTLKQVLINKKKLEFISKFEKEIIEDALQKKEFEIYENNL